MRRTSVLAEGQNLGAGGIHFRRAFEINRVEAASGGRNLKKIPATSAGTKLQNKEKPAVANC